MTSLAEIPGEARSHRYIYKLMFSTDRCSCCEGKLLFRKSYTWCRACRTKTSAKAVSWLRGSNLSHRKILQLIWCWQAKKSPGFAKDALHLSYPTIARWYGRLRAHLPPDTPDKLSGLVEIDESFFGKKKYGGQTIVVGAIEPTTRRIKLQIIDNRDQDTLEEFSELNIAKNTQVMTDLHGGYADLHSLGYEHLRFNHSKGEYTHTNQIENLWGVIKRYMRKLYGCIPTKHLQSILDEWTARQNRPSLFCSPQDYLDACLFRIS